MLVRTFTQTHTHTCTQLTRTPPCPSSSRLWLHPEAHTHSCTHTQTHTQGCLTHGATAVAVTQTPLHTPKMEEDGKELEIEFNSKWRMTVLVRHRERPDNYTGQSEICIVHRTGLLNSKLLYFPMLSPPQTTPDPGAETSSPAEVHLRQCMQRGQQTGGARSHCAAGKLCLSQHHQKMVGASSWLEHCSEGL